MLVGTADLDELAAGVPAMERLDAEPVTCAHAEVLQVTYEIATPQLTPWVDEARIAREGIALYCPADDSICMKALNARAAGSAVGRRVEVEISRIFLGIPGKAERYVIVTIPPR